MSIVKLSPCAARAITHGPGCVGPVDAVLTKLSTGDITGCVLHAVMLKDLFESVRFYPMSSEGAAVAAYYLASELDAWGDEDSIRRRAARLLIEYARETVELILLGEDAEVTS